MRRGAKFLMLGMMLGIGMGARASGAEARRANVVVILADDLGFSDLGCYGSEIATPNVDRLAAHGLRFTQFYNGGRCCPTRAALLTGLYPHQAGVGGMEEDRGQPAYRGFLSERCVTIAEVLRAQGYRTCLSGKWNVGATRPHWPVDRGFEHAFGLLRGAADYFDPREGPRKRASEFALDDEPFTDFPADFYATDAFTDHAVRWIESAAGQGAPFFLYTAYTAPHSPLQARPEDIAKYRGKYRESWDALREKRRAGLTRSGLFSNAALPPPAEDPRVPPWAQVKDADFEDLKMAVYAAQVESMDRGIGRIIAALERKGVLDDTLILFLSDNGADGAPEPATKEPPGGKGSSHIYGRGWAHASNTPWRGYKREMYEGGIATPLVVHWPALIRQAGITHEPGHVIDILPTCLDAAGAVYPREFAGHEVLPVEGRSLMPIFRTGKREPHETLCWEHEGHRAVRQGNWKVVATPGAAWELYDLSIDRGEAKNLAAGNAAKVRELAAVYEAWAAKVGVKTEGRSLGSER